MRERRGNRHRYQMPPGQRHILTTAFAMCFLALLTACNASPSAAQPSPPSQPTEIVAHCFGYTARLALESGDDNPPAPMPATRASGMRWRLTVEASTGTAIDDTVSVSLDTFTIRGEQANRLDLAIVRWSGMAQELMAQGVLLLPELEGTIREGDQGRILAFIRTPAGIFGIHGFVFPLRPEGASIAILSPVPLTQEPCQAPTSTPQA